MPVTLRLVQDYRAMPWVVLHVAYTVDDVAKERERLLAAGAKPDTQIIHADNGDTVTTLRDPWGLPVQLVKRAVPLL